MQHHPTFHGEPAVEIGFPGLARFAYLKPLTGSDEDSVTGADTASAVALIDRLLTPGPPPCALPGDAAALSAGQRDRIMAVLQERVFGPRIVATPRCNACRQPFDVDFKISDLCAHVRSSAASAVHALPEGGFEYEGLRFRLPNALDEWAVATLPPAGARAALIARCAGPDATEHSGRLERAMAAVDPLIDLDLPTKCAECGTAQNLRFAIQSYFLSSLAAERRRLAEDVHTIAAGYGWSRGEILAMRTTTRRLHVDLLAVITRRRSA